VRIIHIFQAHLSPEGGMGRVSHHWLEAFRRSGFETLSLDASNVPRPLHQSFFDLAARKLVKPQLKSGDLLLVHEPLAGTFLNMGVPLILFSHGVEKRVAAVERQYGLKRFDLKSLVTWPLWWRRYWARRRGFLAADLALVLNREDYAFALSHYGRNAENTFLFSNGVTAAESIPSRGDGRQILFIGTWLERKGITLLRAAYQHFRASNAGIKWCFAGTGADEKMVRGYLGAQGDASVKVVPHFKSADEVTIFEKTDIFVLPSYAEGQPLALLQAMEYGRCCITTNSSGQKDVIIDGENGLLFEVGDKDGFIKKIEAAAGSAKLLDVLGKRAQASMANKRWPEVADEVVRAVTNYSSKV
jgi:glycosyltransferase involved in cell wall biosynthesis